MFTSHRLAKSVRNVFTREVPGPSPSASHPSGNTVESPTARGPKRLLAAGAAVAAVTAAVVATSAPAHADVTVMRAGLACGYNRVYAYAPSADYTRSTLAGVCLLYTSPSPRD